MATGRQGDRRASSDSDRRWQWRHKNDVSSLTRLSDHTTPAHALERRPSLHMCPCTCHRRGTTGGGRAHDAENRTSHDDDDRGEKKEKGEDVERRTACPGGRQERSSHTDFSCNHGFDSLEELAVMNLSDRSLSAQEVRPPGMMDEAGEQEEGGHAREEVTTDTGVIGRPGSEGGDLTIIDLTVTAEEPEKVKQDDTPLLFRTPAAAALSDTTVSPPDTAASPSETDLPPPRISPLPTCPPLVEAHQPPVSAAHSMTSHASRRPVDGEQKRAAATTTSTSDVVTPRRRQRHTSGRRQPSCASRGRVDDDARRPPPAETRRLRKTNGVTEERQQRFYELLYWFEHALHIKRGTTLRLAAEQICSIGPERFEQIKCNYEKHPMGAEHAEELRRLYEECRGFSSQGVYPPRCCDTDSSTDGSNPNWDHVPGGTVQYADHSTSYRTTRHVTPTRSEHGGRCHSGDPGRLAARRRTTDGRRQYDGFSDGRYCDDYSDGRYYDDDGRLRGRQMSGRYYDGQSGGRYYGDQSDGRYYGGHPSEHYYDNQYESRTGSHERTPDRYERYDGDVWSNAHYNS